MYVIGGLQGLVYHLIYNESDELPKYLLNSKDESGLRWPEILP